MKLLIIRELMTDTETMGSLYIDNEFFCYTLEDTQRVRKVAGDTCIPFGTGYKVKTTLSPRFNKDLPLVWNTDKDLTVKNIDGDSWAGIRLHGGNHHLHTLGCVLVAKNRYMDLVKPVSFTYEGQTISVNNYIQGSMIEPLITKLGKTQHTLDIRYSPVFKDKRVVNTNGQPIFKVGSQGLKQADICTIQNALNIAGFRTLSTVYNEEMKESVKKFQKSKGLSDDGVAGKDTIKALKLIWDGYQLIEAYDYLNNKSV